MRYSPHPNDTGMGRIAAVLADETCGEACWNALQDTCRCSCGGLNHGCLKDKNGRAPARSAKIDGVPYVLIAVGLYSELCGQAQNLLSPDLVGYKSVVRVTDTLTYRYPWKETDRGAPVRLKRASRAQIAGWRELAPWRDSPEAAAGNVGLLWRRVQSLKEAARMVSPIQL